MRRDVEPRGGKPIGITRVELDREGTSRTATLIITGVLPGEVREMLVEIDDEADFDLFLAAETAGQRRSWDRGR